MLAARQQRRRCSRCLRHFMLAAQRTPRLLPDRVVARTASAGCVRPQVPEPCSHREEQPPRDHLRQHGAGPHHRTQPPLEPPGCTSHFQCLGVVARSRAEITHAKHGAGLPQNTTTPLEPAGCTSHFQCLGVGARSRAGRGLTKVPGGAVTTTSCSGVQTSSKHT